MSSNVRALHLPRAAALEWLRQQTLAALAAWARDWLSGWTRHDVRLASLQVTNIRNGVQPQPGDYVEVTAASGGLWVRDVTTDRTAFARAVLGVESTSASEEWANGAVEEAWSARSQALCATLLGSSIERNMSREAPPASVFALGSGAVCLSCEALGLHAIADNAVWRSAPAFSRSSERRLPPLVALSDATRERSVRLEAILGSVEIEVPALMDLRSGDVVRLTRRLTDGIEVLCERKPLASAALGAAHGRKGVQLLAAHESVLPEDLP